tara:strand:- start:124 stop:486 length:363 start_codon:yes stop_codon:yes gene_type:complete
MTQVKNRLTFVKFHHFYHYTRKGYTEKIPFDLYRCECGKEVVKRRVSVKSENPNSVFSCGCLRMENVRKLHSSGLAVKGNKAGRKKGCTPHNKGKVRITLNGKIRYVNDQELSEIYYGVA